jgi:hemoglobin/transferrin/lactoferrin receptor protein
LHADFDSWYGSLLVLYNGRKDKEDYDLASGTDNLEESPIVWAQSQEGNWIKEYRGTPPWYTVNMSAACHLSEHLDLQVAIDNIFDHHYKTFSSGVSSPGRNFILTIRASF